MFNFVVSCVLSGFIFVTGITFAYLGYTEQVFDPLIAWICAGIWLLLTFPTSIISTKSLYQIEKRGRNQ